MADNETETKVAETAAKAVGAGASGKLSDYFEAIFTGIALLLGRGVIKEGSEWASEKIEIESERLHLWRHHKLVVLCRPFLPTALFINLCFALAVGYYLFNVASPDGLQRMFGSHYLEGTGLELDSMIWWIVIQAGLLLMVAFRWGRTWFVKDVSLREYTEFGKRLLETDPNIDKKAIRKKRNAEFGPTGRYGAWSLFLTFGTYPLTGILSLAIGGWAYDHGVPWLYAAPLVLVVPVLTTLIGAWVFAAQFLPTVGLAIGVFEVLQGAFSLLWDSVFTTALLNVVGNEANKAKPDFSKYGLAEKWAFLKQLLATTPVAVVLAVFALGGICWPSPLWVGATAALLFGLGSGSLFSGIMGNDEDPSRKQMGKLVKTILSVGTVYRILEINVSPYRQLWPDLWQENTSNHYTHPVTGWMQDLWRGLISADWVTAAVLAAAFLGMIILIAKYLPAEGRMRRVKQGLIGALAAALIILMGAGITYMIVNGVHLREVRDAAREAGHELGLIETDAERRARERREAIERARRQATAPRTVAAPPPPPVTRQYPSLGVTRDVPPIPLQPVTPRTDPQIALSDLPDCDSIDFRTDSYRETSRNMGRCR